jgi:hypothetical protein
VVTGAGTVTWLINAIEYDKLSNPA